MSLRRILFLTAAASVFVSFAGPVSAESLSEAMASAYSNNPDLNSVRAATRAADEGVSTALAGYRPKISAFAKAGVEAVDTHTGYTPGYSQYMTGLSNVLGGTGTVNSMDLNYTDTTAAVGLQIVQPIYTGGYNDANVGAAESSVKAARQQLRYAEQQTLMAAVSTYTAVIATRQLLDLRQSNVKFLQEQVRAARDRLSVGEGTKTDVSQAEAALAAADAQVSLAQAQYQEAAANFLRVVGHKPGRLSPASPASRLLPGSLDAAINASRTEHPQILAALANADTARHNVEKAEAALKPQLSITGSVQQSWTDYNGHSSYTSNGTLGASIMGNLTIPIYQGGSEYSTVRQAKEMLGKSKIDIDSARSQVQAALASAWGQLGASRAEIDAAKAGVTASQLALDGVIEEQKVGQRTTLDVLNAQSTLISAKASLVGAERDVVVASYNILSATGRLDHSRLGLHVVAYKPETHYQAVRDKWVGLRTPAGD